MTQGRRNDIIVVYDNFEFQENVKHQIIGQQPELRSVTTGKIVGGANIPEGGLKQSMLNQSIGLKTKDVIDNNLGLYEDEIQVQLSTFFYYRCYQQSLSGRDRVYFQRASHTAA